jgi:hypothetical protein
VLSPISVLAIDLATTGLKSRNLIAGADVSSHAVWLSDLLSAQGREELTTKATACLLLVNPFATRTFLGAGGCLVVAWVVGVCVGV